MMRGRYNPKIAKALSERGRRMANAKWAKDRAKREKEAPARRLEIMLAAIENLPSGEGDITHCLQITDFSTGKVRRWLLRRGHRINQTTLEKVGGKRTASMSGTRIMDKLRAFLFGEKRHLVE